MTQYRSWDIYCNTSSQMIYSLPLITTTLSGFEETDWDELDSRGSRE